MYMPLKIWVYKTKELILQIFVTGYLNYQVPKLIPTVRFFHLNLFEEISGIFSLDSYIINVWKTFSKSILLVITELQTTIAFLVRNVYLSIKF